MAPSPTMANLYLFSRDAVAQSYARPSSCSAMWMCKRGANGSQKRVSCLTNRRTLRESTGRSSRPLVADPRMMMKLICPTTLLS